MYKKKLGSILLSSQSQSSTICLRTYKQSKGKRKKKQQNNKAEEVTSRHHGLKLHYSDIQCSFLPPSACSV